MKRRTLLGTSLGAAGLAAGGAGRPALAQTAGVIRIGYQPYGTLILLKQRGTLEKLLAPHNFTVSWAEFLSGPPLLQALNAGAIDFGTTGETPPIFAQASGADIVYVANDPPAPRGEAILVPTGSPIKTVGALKGKRVAVTKGSNAHYLLVAALLKSGLAFTDIEPVYLSPPNGNAAFHAGSIDAWAVWDPFFAAAQQGGARVLVDGTGIVPNHQFFLASRKFADANTAVVHTTLEALDGAETWVRQNSSAAAAQLAPGTGIPQPVLELSLSRQPTGVRPVSAAVFAQQQQIADTFFKLGLIPHPVKVTDAGWNA